VVLSLVVSTDEAGGDEITVDDVSVHNELAG
jgi:hypothetical protein